jgi:PKD repeat protein
VSQKPVARIVVLCLFALLAFASGASAQNSNVSKDKTYPVTNEQITFTANFAYECPGGTGITPVFTFTIDDAKQPSQGTDNDIVWTFTTAGTHRVTATMENCGGGTGTLTFDVSDALTGSISVDPDPPIVNQQATLAATQTGGYPGYTWAWDLDNDGGFDDSTSRTPTITFPTTGAHTVKVRIRDLAGPPQGPNPHETVVTRTLNVVDPPAPPPPGATPTPTPTPPPCRKELTFALSEFTTTGCFKQVSTTPERWETTSAIQFNGIPLQDFGQTFSITFPTATEPGGHFKAPNSSIQLGTFTAFSGSIDWTLPAGVKGDGPDSLKDVETFNVLAGTRMFGLNVRGSVALRIGWGSDGVHYATFPLNIELPGGFTAGPDPSLGRVTGSASLRVDPAGVHYDGLRLAAKDVWVGKLKVPEVCFSYSPAGSQGVTTCKASELGGKEFITCNSDVNTDRWDGNATIELPRSGVKLAAFGGLADGQVSRLGGFVDKLGRRAPIASNVYLNTIGVGLCLTPPPFKLRGTVGISVFPAGATSAAAIDGTVLYTDSTSGRSWTLEIGGNVRVFDKEVGTGSVTLRGYGGMDFALAAGISAEGIASLSGQISGWVDPDTSHFAVSGSAKACAGTLCAEGSGLVSDIGAAGCISIVSTIQSPDLLVSFDPFRVRFDTRQLVIRAGFGYRWNGSVDLFGSSCNFGDYQRTRTLARAAQSGPVTQAVAKDTVAVTWRIKGSDGPPKVVLRGPKGESITSPTTGGSAEVKGKYMLVENPTDGTTNVVLIKPTSGTWTVAALPGTGSLPTAIDQAKSEVPPTVGGKVRTSRGRNTLEVAYAIPRGTSLALVERTKGISRTLVKSVRGRRCSAGPAKRPGSDQRILCTKVRFRASRGPGGTRSIQAVVTRKGVPISQENFATFKAPRETLPGKVGTMRARRVKGGALEVTFGASSGASRYVVSAKLSDGRELAFDLGSKCRGVRIPAAPKGIAATVKVAGVRYDLASGKPRALKIKSTATTAGPKRKRGKGPRICT